MSPAGPKPQWRSRRLDSLTEPYATMKKKSIPRWCRPSWASSHESESRTAPRLVRSHHFCTVGAVEAVDGGFWEESRCLDLDTPWGEPLNPTTLEQLSPSFTKHTSSTTLRSSSCVGRKGGGGGADLSAVERPAASKASVWCAASPARRAPPTPPQVEPIPPRSKCP